MLKKIGISLVLIVVLAVGAFFYYFDSIVKNGIEVVGSQVLGTDVTVSDVSISPLSGTGTLRGLTIANPEGYSAPQAFQLDEVSIALDPGSIFEDVVEINSITIVQPQITYETRITTDNIRALLENVSSDADSSGAESGTDSPGRQLLIREFRMLDPQLNLVAAVVTAPLPLPDIEMNDIGTEDRAATAAEVLSTILSALSRSILNANLPSIEALRDGVEGALQEGVEQVEDAVEDAVDDAVDELSNRLRSILN